MPILLLVNPFQETLNQSYCGPATLKMVLDFYGVNKTEDELAELLKCNPELGVEDKSIKEVAESFGFKVEIKNFSSFDDIDKWLNINVPVIVDWFTRGRDDYGEDSVASGHYSVVVGLDDQIIYLQDPEVGRLRKIPKDEFMSVWFDYTGYYPKSWEEMIVRQTIAIYK
jgi:ABC-type bacteriocin/lantibiotic exporter with double-glycine peptidase domain